MSAMVWTNQSDRKTPVLELRGIWSNPSLPLFLGSLWPGVLEVNNYVAELAEEYTDCISSKG